MRFDTAAISSRWSCPYKLQRRTQLAVLALCCLGFICSYPENATAQIDLGFVSVDIGAPAGKYTDTKTKTEWVSDAADDQGAPFARSLHIPVEGEGVRTVAAPVQAPTAVNETQSSLRSLRYFPGQHGKSCYVFSQDDYPFIRPGTPFLVRASFWAGNLTFGATTTTNTTFQLHINADIWDQVSITLPQPEVVVKEAYLLPANNTSPPSISVCLAGRGVDPSMGIPFISSLELRLLPPDFTSFYSSYYRLPMHCIYTMNYGAATNDVIRYPHDPLDRIWQPDTSSHRPTQSTAREIDWQRLTRHAPPPPEVLRTAYVEDERIMLILPVPKGAYDYYLAAYILDVSETQLVSKGQRVFTWQTTGYAQNNPIDLFKSDQGFMTLYSGFEAPLHAEGDGYLNITLTKAPNSTYGPLINALQLFRAFGTVSPGTYTQDADSINFIQTNHFTSLRGWSGDPCLPYPYNWLNCTYDDAPQVLNLLLSNKSLEGTFPPRINSLQSLVGIFLDHNKLFGTIPHLGNLDKLQILDLSDNNFSGQIPSALADLPSLKTLLLDNNNFSGEVPREILEKFSTPNFKLSFSGNPLLCPDQNCVVQQQSSKKSNIALVASLISIVVVAVLIIAIIYFKRKRGKHLRNLLSGVGKAKERTCFSYNEIKSITNNFKKQLGVGGFGPVYYGELPNGCPVAVKVLSAASHQGESEFLNEVNLLSRIHHKNLVPLLGYCVEEKLVLIYEYMSNGSLLDNLEGKCSVLNTWKDHLRVAVDAAEGLEYLHNGCNPQIVHRDVKSSNILISQKVTGKLSDFGISRSKVSTTGDLEIITAVQGSIGYLDPEYAERQVVTPKVDVYAFGIVLLEICSGRPAFCQHSGRQPQHLSDWVKGHVERGNIHEIMNPSFDGHYKLSAAWKVVDVAMTCVEYESKKRPNMSDVCLELKAALSIELYGEVIDTNPNMTFTTNITAR